MVDKSVMLVLHKKGSKKRLKTVMNSRLERLPEKNSPGIWQPDLTSAGCFVCLLGAMAYVVMTTKKKVSAVVKKSPSIKRAKKVRSISMSLDLECPGRIPYSKYPLSSQENGYSSFKKPSRLPSDRNRTVSACEFVEQYMKESISKSELRLRFGKLASNPEQVEDWFPIDVLPLDCKLKVFSFLQPRDRGMCAQVCTEWRALIKTSSLWNVVDMTSFPLCHIQTPNHQCSELCYANYRQKIKQFFQYMQYVRPVLKRLRFSFDIGDFKDGWLESLQGLLDTARMQELEYAHLNWKESPVKPFARDSITWSTNDYNDLMHRHRHRQRLFVNFFDHFTAAAPNVSKLILPFDWSARSLQALCRLQKLEILVLEKYFVFQNLEQIHLDRLLEDLPLLRRLVLEIWTPSGRGLVLYSMESTKLEQLDISQCRGFYLRKVKLPKVEVFKVSRHHWNGPITTVDSINVPCIHDVLRDGAPKLQQLNEHILHPDWRDNVYLELETILKAVCSCPRHKTGWVM